MTEGFSANWLALREPVDARSRSAALAERLATAGSGGPRRICDLACGTGANLRYLAPILGGEQDWLLVDRDVALLDALDSAMRPWAKSRRIELVQEGETLLLTGPGLRCRIRRRALDLAKGFQQLGLDDRWLVTASALLDLVSRPWLEELLARSRAVGARLLLALTYDGTMELRPRDGRDVWVTALVNRHQRGDKGWGPAMGPRAAAEQTVVARLHGFRVTEASTPWHIGSDDAALQHALVDGWARAARELEPAAAGEIAAWQRLRHCQAAAGSLSLSVGHRDLLALPPT